MPAPTRTDLRDYGIDTRAIVSAPVAVLVNPTTGQLYAEGHGLETGDAFRFALTGVSSPVVPTSSPTIALGPSYYAIRWNAALFSVALTDGGEAVAFSDAGKGVSVIRDLDATIDRMLAADFAHVMQHARAVPSGDPRVTPEDIKAMSCRRTAWLLCSHRWLGVVLSKERFEALKADVESDNAMLEKLWAGAPIKGLVSADPTSQPAAVRAIPDKDPRGLQMSRLR